jgi:hypothetical protein
LNTPLGEKASFHYRHWISNEQGYGTAVDNDNYAILPMNGDLTTPLSSILNTANTRSIPTEPIGQWRLIDNSRRLRGRTSVGTGL